MTLRGSGLRLAEAPAAARAGLRRTIRALAGLLAAASLASCAGEPPAPPAAPGDCVTLRLWSNGFHTNIALPAELFDAAHPVRALFPQARYVLIGWGERDYYMNPDPGVLDALAAIAGPRPSVVQVIAHDAPVEDSLWPARELADFGVSRAGAARLAAALADTLALDAQGAPVVLGEGRVPGASAFLAARPAFHLLHMCNHWTAARLREAGAPVRVRPSFAASALLDAARAKAPPCRELDG